MAYPTFSHPGVPFAVEFDTGVLSPMTIELETNQSFQLSDDQAGVYVYTYAAPMEVWTLPFADVPTADRDLMMSFFGHAAVHWQENTFTFTDELSQDHTMQLLDSRIQFQHAAAGLWSWALRLWRRG